MSTTDPAAQGNDVEAWLAGEFEDEGAFTALIVLVEIGETTVTPVASTFLNVIGADVRWSELVALFAGSGQSWNGAAFFPVRDPDGDPLDNGLARLKLKQIEERLAADRLVLNEGHFFDAPGRRLRIDEMTRQ